MKATGIRNIFISAGYHNILDVCATQYATTQYTLTNFGKRNEKKNGFYDLSCLIQKKMLLSLLTILFETKKKKREKEQVYWNTA